MRTSQMKKKKARKFSSNLRERMGGLLNTVYALIKLFELWF